MMNRRTLFSNVFNRRAERQAASATMTTTLAPYTGSFGIQEAKHLLRRTTYGTNRPRILGARDLGLEATIDLLFSEVGPPDPPINYTYVNNNPDWPDEVPVGETWVNEPSHLILRNPRRESTKNWYLNNVYQEGTSIRQKMIFFWMNHFVAADIQNLIVDTLNYMMFYRYIETLYTHLVGDFRALTKAITINPLMLGYLGGDVNIAAQPNENYARELLELFILGKGEQVEVNPGDPADYTTYTEQDVVEIAKILTGWKYEFVDGYVSSYFDAANHDTTTKTLSHRFGNQQVPNDNENEYANLIDIVFDKPECAQFICRELYRYFVFHDVSETVETNIIQPMAQILIDNDYVIEPALRALLSSEHFFDTLNMGVQIQSPMEVLLGTVKCKEGVINLSELVYQRDFGRETWEKFFNSGFTLFGPTNVAGWPAYYLAPNYDELWLDPVSMRMYLAWSVGPVNWAFYNYNVNIGAQLDLIAALENISTLSSASQIYDPSDPTHVVEGFVAIFLPCPLPIDRIEELKDILKGQEDLPDFEWTVEYNNWQNNPNSTNTNLIHNRIKAVWQAIFTAPEAFLN